MPAGNRRARVGPAIDRTHEIGQIVPMSGPNAHHRGIALTTLGVLVLSFDALLIRLAAADTWTVVFWRGLGSGLVLILAAAWLEDRGLARSLRRLARPIRFGAPCYALASITFVYAIGNTAVANVLILLAAVPLMAAGIAWIWLREPVRGDTLIAAIVVIGGLALVFQDSIGLGTWDGDLAALLSGLFIAGYLTVLRGEGDVGTLPVTGIGSLLAALLVLPLAWAGFPGVPAQGFLPLAVLALVIVPLAFALISSGPRTLPAPEVSLLMLLESVTGPAWVWLALGEQPTVQVALGGAVVLGTLGLYFARRLHRRPAAAPPPARD